MFSNISLRFLGPHIWNTIPGIWQKKYILQNSKNLLIVGTDQVVNVVFVLTKNEIKLLIWNSQQSVPAWYKYVYWS